MYGQLPPTVNFKEIESDRTKDRTGFVRQNSKDCGPYGFFGKKDRHSFRAVCPTGSKAL